jgi:hypothetical protein
MNTVASSTRHAHKSELPLARFSCVVQASILGCNDEPHIEASYYGPVNAALIIMFKVLRFIVKPQGKLRQDVPAPAPPQFQPGHVHPHGAGSAGSYKEITASSRQQPGIESNLLEPDFIVALPGELNDANPPLHSDTLVTVVEVKRDSADHTASVKKMINYMTRCVKDHVPPLKGFLIERNQTSLFVLGEDNIVDGPLVPGFVTINVGLLQEWYNIAVHAFEHVPQQAQQPQQ